MADIQSNIKVNVDTSNALEQIKLLQGQISAFHLQMAKGGAQAAAQAAQLRQSLVNGINATGKFQAQMTSVKTSTEYFTQALEKNKLTMGEYFRYAGGASKTFGKLFKSEFETIGKVARERVKDLQTQYIKMGRDANGAMQAIKVRPLALDMENLGTKTAIAAQKQQLLNQLLKQGSTNLLNFGKNTQWAGRQLMVGFTVPLMMFGSVAVKSFNEMEKAVVKFKRVYGDMNTMKSDTDKMVGEVRRLAESYTQYGIAIKDTMDMAATAAATGKMGKDLLAQVASATKLAVLGGVDQQKSLETTISLTNAFGLSAEQLAQKIDFLNAVENQTVLSIDDLTTAIPKAAPVVQQLGGNVEDLAFFLTAMKEGGINASEGANALKSGLASLINPTNTASKMLAGFGINIKGIVEGDKGNLKKTVVDFATALNQLDPLNRAKAIEQLFGKFQFARLSTLFKNVTDQGSQAARTLELTKASAEELAIVSQREMARISESPTFKFEKAMKDFQAAMMPIGEQFLKAATPILNFFSDILKRFDGLDDGTKGFITGLTGLVAGIGPVVLMVVGLVANGVANIIKLFANFKSFFNNLGKGSKDLATSTKYMTSEQIEAASVAASLDQVHGKLTQTFTSEAAAISRLVAEYQKAITAQEVYRGIAIPKGAAPRAYASGGLISGPGSGTSDSILARVSNGEAIIPASSVSRYPGLVKQLVSGNVPGFSGGTEFAHITSRKTMGIGSFYEGLIELEKQGLVKLSQARKIMFNDYMQMFGRDAQIHTYSGLGFTQSKGLNVGMRNGGAVPATAFLSDFKQQGLAKWEQSLKMAGLKQQEVTEELTRYDQALQSGVQRMIDMNRSATITDTDFELIHQEAVKTLPAQSKLRMGLEAAANGLYETRMNINEGMLSAAGIEAKQVPSGADPTRMSTKKRFFGPSGKQYRTGGNRWYRYLPGGLAGRDVAPITAQQLEQQGIVDGRSYEKGKKSITDNPQNDPYVESRNRNSPHVLSGPDGEQDAVAYNTARRTTNAEFDVTEAEAARARSMSMQAIAAESGQVEGTAHAEARVAAARTENAEVLAVYREGQAAELAAMEQQNAMLMSGGTGGYVGRRATILAEREAAAQAKAAQKLANKTALKDARAKASQNQSSGKFQKIGMAAMMPTMMGSMAGGQIGEISQQLMMPMMMMSMITGPVTGVIAALGALALAAWAIKNAYDEQIKKQLELTEKTGLGSKAMENLASYAKKATSTEIMNVRRGNQLSLFNTKIGKTTYGQSFLESDEGKKLLEGVQSNIVDSGQKVANTQLAAQLQAAVVNGIFTEGQALSIADSVGRQLKNYNLSMDVSARLLTVFGPDGKDVSKDPLLINARLQIIQTGQESVTTNESNYNFDKTANGKYNTNIPMTGRRWLNIQKNIVDIAQNAGTYVGTIKSQLENVQMQMDGLYIDYQTAMDEAIKNNDTNRIYFLNKKYKAGLNLLTKSSIDAYDSLISLYNSAGPNSGSVMDAQKAAIDAAFKGTTQEKQATQVKDLIDGLKNTSNINKLVLEASVANKSLDLNAAQTYLNKYQGDSTMVARLGTTIRNLGGTAGSDMAMLASEMNKTSANQFTKNIALAKNPLEAQTRLNAMMDVRRGGGVGGPGATENIENFFGKNINLGKLTAFENHINALRNSKEITLPVIAKIYGAQELSQMTADAQYIKSLNKDNKIVYTQTFDTYYNMIGDPKFYDQYTSWKNGEGKNIKPNDIVAYVRWLARQATEAAKVMSSINPAGGNGGNGGTPESSFLDAIVKTKRDIFDFKQALTTGFDASKAAIDKFKITGANGLMMQLASAGAGPELIKAIIDAPQDQIDKIVDKTTGKIKASFLKTLPKVMASMDPNGFAQIATRWLGLSADEKIQEHISLYQSGLEVIKIDEDKINKTYEQRIKALDEIQSLNNEVNRQEQDKLTLADALAKGDISAATRAAYQMKQNNAQAAIEATKKSLENARQAEINALTVKIGGKTVTRAELEERIADATAIITRHKKTQLDREIKIGEQLDAQIEKQKTLNALQKTPAAANTPKQTPAPNNSDGGGGPRDVAMATGGHIRGPGTGTSDDIPAMLSNGEYVIRANAVKTIGVSTLDRLNQADRMKFSDGGPVTRGPRINDTSDDPGNVENKKSMLQKAIDSARQRLNRTNPTQKAEGPLWSQYARSVAAMMAYTYRPPAMPSEDTMMNFWNPEWRRGDPSSQKYFNRYPTLSDFKNYRVNSFKGGRLTTGPNGRKIMSPNGNYFTWYKDDMFGNRKNTISSILGDFNNLDYLWNLRGIDVAPMMGYEKIPGVLNDMALKKRKLSNWSVFRNRQIRQAHVHGGTDAWAWSESGNQNYDYYKKMFGKANGGLVGYKDGGKPKNWSLTDPSAPWNQGDYKKFNDYQTRKQYWAMSQPGSRELVETGKNIGYFTPGIGSGLAFGDAGTSFGKGDIGGGLLNTAFGFGAMWIPKAIGAIGKGIKTAGSSIGQGFNAIKNTINATKKSYTHPKDWLTKYYTTSPNKYLGIKGLQAVMGKMLPKNLEALVLNKFGKTRSEKAGLGVEHPEDVEVVNGRLAGPGTYFAKTNTQSDIFHNFGDFVYGIKNTPKVILDTLLSKGYADEKTVLKVAAKNGWRFPEGTKATDLLQDSHFNSPLIQQLRKLGYLGYKGTDDAFTNWMLGDKKGWGFTKGKFDNRGRLGAKASNAEAAAAKKKSQTASIFAPYKDSALGSGGIESGIWMKNTLNNVETYLKHYAQQEKSFLEPMTSFIGNRLGASVAPYDLITSGNFLKNEFTGTASNILKHIEGNRDSLLVASPKIPNSNQIRNNNIQAWLTKPGMSPNEKIQQLIENVKEFASSSALLNSVVGNLDVHTGNILMDATTGKFHALDFGNTRLQQMQPSLENATGGLSLARRATDTLLNALRYNIREVFSDDQIDKKLFDQLQSGFMSVDPSKFMNRLKVLSQTDYVGQFVKEKIGDNPLMLSQFGKWMEQTIPSPTPKFSHFGTFGNDPNFLKIIYENLENEFKQTGGMFHFANGGMAIPRFKTGGYVGMMPKFGDGGLANLHQGEYVFQKSAVDRIGLNSLNAMNQGETSMGDCVYNYNINLNVSSMSNQNDIADAVIGQIRRLDNQRIRGNTI